MKLDQPGFISSDELKQTFGYEHDGDLANFLRKKNIPCIQRKKHGVVTTWAAVNIALATQGGYLNFKEEEPKGVM